MDIKKKIYDLKKRSVEIAALAATMFPSPSGMSASNFDKDFDNETKKLTAESLAENQIPMDILTDSVSLNIQEFKTILESNPDIKFSAELLGAIQPGPSQQKMRSILTKGFHFTIRNSRGQKKYAKCSIAQTPQGYCAGAVKRLLHKVYNEPISGNLSAYQEKDHLAKSANFLGVPIQLKDIENCPINTVVVIPKCTGHPHGHILTVVEKGVYCSDGKETAGPSFEDNYKDAKGIYAFIPVDGSIHLTPEILQNSPELYASILQRQSGKEIQPVNGGKESQPVLFAELSAQKDSHSK